MDKIARRSLLFDIYGNLLTDHQRKIYSDVVDNDYSLSEIGEEMGISRQGVHDAVKRIDKILDEYEEKSLDLLKDIDKKEIELEELKQKVSKHIIEEIVNEYK